MSIIGKLISVVVPRLYMPKDYLTQVKPCSAILWGMSISRRIRFTSEGIVDLETVFDALGIYDGNHFKYELRFFFTVVCRNDRRLNGGKDYLTYHQTIILLKLLNVQGHDLFRLLGNTPNVFTSFTYSSYKGLNHFMNGRSYAYATKFIDDLEDLFGDKNIIEVVNPIIQMGYHIDYDYNLLSYRLDRIIGMLRLDETKENRLIWLFRMYGYPMRSCWKDTILSEESVYRYVYALSIISNLHVNHIIK